MKKIILTTFISFFISSVSYSQSKLPKCVGDDQNKYNNCYGMVELPFLGDTKLVYEGEFKIGAFHGFGVLTSPNSKYIGEYNNGRRNGNGTLFLWDQSKYVGEFKDDQKEGKGTLIKQDGSTYVGEFKNDRINGQGTYTSPDGKKSSGLFQNGKLVK